MPVSETATPSYTALIVCSDERAKTLATRLAAKFIVYGVRGQDSWYLDEGQFCSASVDQIKLFNKPDVLFFHTGRGDDKLIPAKCSAKQEFAFSGDVEPGISRPMAHRILAPFTLEQCPVTERFVRELIEMLEGKRCEPPAICIRARGAWLAALAVLAQGYLAVNAGARDEIVSREERAIVEKALREMGWAELLTGQSVDDALGRDLSLQRKQVKDPNWWRQPFRHEDQPGTVIRFDWEEFQEDVRQEWRMAGDEDETAWTALQRLLQALQNSPPKSASLSPPVVASAYLAIAARLKEEHR